MTEVGFAFNKALRPLIQGEKIVRKYSNCDSLSDGVRRNQQLSSPDRCLVVADLVRVVYIIPTNFKELFINQNFPINQARETLRARCWYRRVCRHRFCCRSHVHLRHS